MLCQPACTHRDPGGKPPGARVHYPSLRFPQSTLDDSGRNRGEPLLTLQATWLLSAPTQGCQELSCTENDESMAAATCDTSVLLLPQCTWAPTERCSSPVEVVLTGSKAALPGLVEMLEVPTGDTVLLTKANTIITVEGSRLQPGDALDTSQATRFRHQPPMGLWW